jgi:hypothetical protein
MEIIECGTILLKYVTLVCQKSVKRDPFALSHQPTAFAAQLCH